VMNELRKALAAWHGQQAERSAASLVTALLSIAAPKPTNCATEIRIQSQKAEHVFSVRPWRPGKQVQVNWTSWITDEAFVRYIVKALKYGALLTVDRTYAAYLNGTWEGLTAHLANSWLGSMAKDWPGMISAPAPVGAGGQALPE